MGKHSICTWYQKLKQAQYSDALDPQIPRVTVSARLHMFDVKTYFKRKYNFQQCCPFCNLVPEDFDHISRCHDGLSCQKSIQSTNLECLGQEIDLYVYQFLESFSSSMKNIGTYLQGALFLENTF